MFIKLFIVDLRKQLKLNLNYLNMKSRFIIGCSLKLSQSCKELNFISTKCLMRLIRTWRGCVYCLFFCEEHFLFTFKLYACFAKKISNAKNHFLTFDRLLFLTFYVKLAAISCLFLEISWHLFALIFFKEGNTGWFRHIECEKILFCVTEKSGWEPLFYLSLDCVE